MTHFIHIHPEVDWTRVADGQRERVQEGTAWHFDAYKDAPRGTAWHNGARLLETLWGIVYDSNKDPIIQDVLSPCRC